MRVGIYNRWLKTLGGGEKLSLAIAEYLSKRHSVTMISHKPVSKDLAADHLKIDLSNVHFKIIPERPAIEMEPVTADYDFFINASFMDLFPSRAPHNALLVYFPGSIKKTILTKIRLRIGQSIKKSLMLPTFVDCVFDIQTSSRSFLRAVSSTVKILLPSSRSAYSVHFDLASECPDIRQAAISLDGEPVETIDLFPSRKFIHCQVHVQPKRTKAFRELIIQGRPRALVNDNQAVQMALARFEIDHPRYHLYQIIFEQKLKKLGLRLYRIPSKTGSMLESIDSYTAIWAISEFTRTWIERYWKRPSVILFPLVDVEEFSPHQKKNQILNVGRFFPGGHNKKHLEMIQAFKEMIKKGLKGWELHLAGGINLNRSEDTQYLNKIYAKVKGYPIVIHPNIPFKELVTLYGESAIYWHASGLNEDEEREPVKFEHFGITTVEAMAAGTVPVVIGKGGQKEIVKHGRNGFLWQNFTELKSHTWQLIQDPSLRQRLSETALEDSRLFDKAHFQSNLHKLLQQIGVE